MQSDQVFSEHELRGCLKRIIPGQEEQVFLEKDAKELIFDIAGCFVDEMLSLSLNISKREGRLSLSSLRNAASDSLTRTEVRAGPGPVECRGREAESAGGGQDHARGGGNLQPGQPVQHQKALTPSRFMIKGCGYGTYSACAPCLYDPPLASLSRSLATEDLGHARLMHLLRQETTRKDLELSTLRAQREAVARDRAAFESEVQLLYREQERQLALGREQLRRSRRIHRQEESRAQEQIRRLNEEKSRQSLLLQREQFQRDRLARDIDQFIESRAGRLKGMVSEERMPYRPSTLSSTRLRKGKRSACQGQVHPPYYLNPEVFSSESEEEDCCCRYQRRKCM